jgi:hypothetical protein
MPVLSGTVDFLEITNLYENVVFVFKKSMDQPEWAK